MEGLLRVVRPLSHVHGIRHRRAQGGAQVLVRKRGLPHRGGGALADPSAYSLDDEDRWKIGYSNDSKCTTCSTLNGNTPGDTGVQHIFTYKQAEKYWIWYTRKNDSKGLSRILYEFFTQVYMLLGSVEDAQIRVYEKLSGNQSFYNKSWWLNTGLSKNTSKPVARQAFDPKQLDMRCIYTSQGGTFGRYYFPNDPTWQYYRFTGFGDDPDMEGEQPPMSLVSAENPDTCPGGLFRVAVIDKANLNKVKIKTGGVEVKQPWPVPENYFRVRFPEPKVHARVGIVGCCVWAEEGGDPQPTPKFQTRLLP